MSRIELIATATFALESVVAQELKQLGYTEQRVENNQVLFKADEEAIARTNLWLRAADRIRLKIGEFTAVTFEELFEKTKALPWEEWLPRDARFPVQGKSVKSTLYSVPDCQAIVKKAIVERLKQKHRLEWFPENGPEYKIEVSILKDTVILSIDTSGSGLHKRGYRQLVSEAPLRETMAAALILLSFWNPDRPFIDPFCGSGTLPIEAALIGRNIAPGLSRSFAAESWPRLPKKIWQRLREEARAAIDLDRPLSIRGGDIDDKILKAARQNADMAGVSEDIHFQQQNAAELSSNKSYGVIVCNPPYGERLSEREDVERLYGAIGKSFAKLESWSYYVLSGHPGFEQHFGRRADRKRKLFNGDILCNYYQYYGPRPPRRE